MALDVYDLAKIAAICIDNGGKHLYPPSDVSDPLLDLEAKYLLFASMEDRTLVVGTCVSRPSPGELIELGSMGVWIGEEISEELL